MIVQYPAMNSAIVFGREISVRNSVHVHQANVIIVFRVVVVDHRVQQNNVHVMPPVENVIRICVPPVVLMIFERSTMK